MKSPFKARRFILRLSMIGAMAFLTTNAHALGVVSRSCLPATAQESISVDWGFVPYMLWTASSHYRNGSFLHTTNTTLNAGAVGGWEYTWRSYAGHFGEPWYGMVIGYHWKRNGGLVLFLGNSIAYDCNLAQWGGG